MSVKEVPTLGWTRGSVAASILFVNQRQRDEMAARVRQEMSRQGLTNSRLARKADIAEKTVSRVINARRDPRIDTVERIAKALGLSTEYLLGPPPAALGLGDDGHAAPLAPLAGSPAGDGALAEIREQLQALDARIDQIVNKLEESKVADQLPAIEERLASKIDAADSLNEGRAQEVRQRIEEGFAAIEDLLRRRRRA